MKVATQNQGKNRRGTIHFFSAVNKGILALALFFFVFFLSMRFLCCNKGLNGIRD